jgi:hypothetical protein
VKALVAGFWAAALVLAGCGDYIGGDAKAGSRAPDPAFFFAGDVPVYGQTVSNNDKTALAYQRAIRRIDPCGFADRQTLARIGEISSVGTLYAFDECDVEVKMAGDAATRFISLQLTLGQVAEPPALRAGGVPVYETAKDSCEFLIPVDLSRLPGAQRLRKPDQPFLQVSLIGAQDCAVTKKVVSAIAERVTAGPLPPRDAAAVYPIPLAERDPCEVLSALGVDVDHWDVNRTRPYQCEFGIWRDGFPDVYLDPTFCSAVAFVGPPMQRRLAGGDFVDVANLVVRPAVVVDSDPAGCAGTSPVVEVAATAAKLYG